MSLAGRFTPDWENSKHPDYKAIDMHLQRMKQIEKEERYIRECIEYNEQCERENADNNFSDLTNEI